MVLALPGFAAALLVPLGVLLVLVPLAFAEAALKGGLEAFGVALVLALPVAGLGAALPEALALDAAAFEAGVALRFGLLGAMDLEGYMPPVWPRLSCWSQPRARDFSMLASCSRAKASWSRSH